MPSNPPVFSSPFTFGESAFGGSDGFGIPNLPVDSINIDNGGAFIATRIMPPPGADGSIRFNQPSITISSIAPIPPATVSPLPVLYPSQTFYVNGAPLVL